MSEQGGNGTQAAAGAGAAPTGVHSRHVNDPLIGQVLDGRYRVEKVLGEGGMGIVYKAVHTTLGKALAIKVLRPEVSKNDEIVARFRQEAQSASAIGNQHIIDISDFGSLPDGSTYFVMEFLSGRSLTDAMAQGKFPPERTIRVVKQLAGALGAAHEIGIVHRDMKPDNVQLVERGSEKDFVKVLDFGIAKVGGNTSKLTQAGQVFGTPHYMSPEQCAGTNVDHRTDIYAVGVILYEMATGKVPFDADNLMGILTKHLYENPIAPHDLPPPVDVPPALEAVILKCLQKKADVRYQTMAELAADLEAIEHGLTPKAVMERVDRAAGGQATLTGVEARVSVGMGQPELALRKNKTPLYIGIGVVALLVVGGVVAMMSGGKGSEAANVVKPASDPAKPAEQAPQPAAAPPAAPAAAPVKVTVAAEPAGAEVYVDGSLVGNAPYTVAKPDGDKQLHLELRATGYESKAIVISALTEDTLTVKLTQKPKAEEPRASTHAGSSKPKSKNGAAPAGDKPAAAGGQKSGRVQTEVLDPWN
ncbi:MAG TPA: serine/threonine-protein kinase [Polyangiales bacterium]